jgi:hypothetical protein
MPHLVLKLRMSAAIPLLPLYVVTVWTVTTLPLPCFFHWYPHYLLLLQLCKPCTITQAETGLLETILHVFHRRRLEVTMV